MRPKWNWAKTSRDLEAMTWAEFHDLFMGKEKEIEDAWGIRAADADEKREDQPSSSSRKRQKTFASHKFQGQG